MTTKLTLRLFATAALVSAAAFAQHTDLPDTQYAALNTFMKSAFTFQTGTGSPNGVKAGTVGKDIYTDTSNGNIWTVTTTGNTSTTVWQLFSSRTYLFAAEGINYGGVAAFGGNLPTTVADQPGAVFNSGSDLPVLSFAQGASNRYWFRSFVIPSGYTTNSALGFTIRSMCDPANCDSAGTTNVYASLSCSTSGRADTATYAEFATPTAIVNGAAGARVTSNGTITPNAGGLPACVAGDRAFVKFRVDTTGLASGKAFQVTSMEISITGTK